MKKFRISKIISSKTDECTGFLVEHSVLNIFGFTIWSSSYSMFREYTYFFEMKYPSLDQAKQVLGFIINDYKESKKHSFWSRFKFDKKDIIEEWKA